MTGWPVGSSYVDGGVPGVQVNDYMKKEEPGWQCQDRMNCTFSVFMRKMEADVRPLAHTPPDTLARVAHHVSRAARGTLGWLTCCLLCMLPLQCHWHEGQTGMRHAGSAAQ
jgi:hypothetical protein